MSNVFKQDGGGASLFYICSVYNGLHLIMH